MVMRSQPGCLKQLVQVYEEQGGGNVVALERMPTSDLHKYGVANILDRVDGAPRITGMVEKPKPGQAPSNLVNSGRYILQPEIFDCLDKTPPGTGGEIRLTDAMVQLLKQQPFWGMVFKGDTFDVAASLAICVRTWPTDQVIRKLVACSAMKSRMSCANSTGKCRPQLPDAEHFVCSCRSTGNPTFSERIS